LLFAISLSIPREVVESSIKKAGVFAPIVYIFLTLLTFVIAPLSGAPLTYAGFYAFGHKVVFLSLIAAYIGSIVNFWIARKWGRDFVKKLVGKESVDKIDNIAKDYGIVSLAFLRVFQGSIHDFVSFAAGLTNMNFGSYFIVTIIASIPGTLLWYYISLTAKTPLGFVTIMWVFAGVCSFIFVVGKKLLGK